MGRDVNKLNRNIVVAGIYKHPRYNLTEFISYLEKCLNILIKENKDFYIDLLQIEANNNYQQFYDNALQLWIFPQNYSTYPCH